jgi:lipopolysaccharide export system permease protein
MNTLDRYLIRQFIPVFLGGLILFVFLVELIDLFANIFKYLNQDASALDIIKVSFFYLPKAVSYSLPISLLFASSFVLGDLYSRNELIVVFSSGIPLFRFSFTMIVIGFLFSIGSFYFEDRVVIKTLTLKNELSRVLLKQEKKGAESDIVVKSEGGRLLYITEYFDIANTILVNITIVERDSNGNFCQ